MKNYKLNKIINGEEREKWIKENGKDLIHNLNAQLKLVLLLLYHIREFENLNEKCTFFQVTYCQINKYMRLLKSLGLIDITPNGRNMRYKISFLGDKLCLEMFDRMKKI